ncbi:MAG: nodulation protein NfeD [Flavobacteriales bacterium]|nr:nodulation protein NfeD [Flavobacteriales bacterium]
MRYKTILALSILFFSFLLTGFSQEKSVYVFKIAEEIDMPAWRKSKKAIEEAHRINADLIFLKMNTYGGSVLYADSISEKIFRSSIPVYVLIENNAASAGAFISLSCDSIYMLSASTIGAATVVDGTGEKSAEKYQSYFRKKIRAKAEANGRDPNIAEAMVDESIAIEGVTEEGKLVTFTTLEAIEHGFCDAQVGSIEEALAHAGIKEYKLTFQKLSEIDTILDFLTSSAVSGFLIMIIIGGIYFELQSPGIGFPILASLIAALLYFAPHYLEGLAENWEILLFIGGVILLALEVFVIPGFGVAGVLGIILVISGLTLSLVGNVGFEFSPVNGDELAQALFTVIISMVLSVSLSIYFGVKLLNSKLFGSLILETSLNKEDGFISVDSSEFELIGREGITTTILRPVGKIEIDGNIYDASAESGYIEQGEKVKVVRFETAQLFVRSI